jgi:hypothetical protein
MVTNSQEAYEVITKLTEAQHNVLNAIAVGEDGRHNRRILASLCAKGLIEAFYTTLGGMPGATSVIDRLPITITRYRVPVFVHIAWCTYWSERYTEDDETIC